MATPYRRTGAPDPYDGLRHPDLVDPRIRLFDGNLGCGSCHSVYAGEPGLLVMRNERSRLCTSCHDL
ncbi:MAG: hypothetical protein HKO98_05620 [Gemmatimonadetes bacterium]|nr:hypothetical protein [Gemmatimonadota bacterium]